MANEQNLIPGQHKLTKEEQSRAGIKSGEVRREKKLWREEIMKRLGEKDWNKIVDNLIDRASKNSKDFEVLRDTMGQKPTDTIQVETKLPVFNIEVTDNKELEKEFDKMDETNT